MTLDRTNFVHRPNRDGTIDSICLQCFITVASKLNENDLEQPELDHACDPALLEWYRKAKRETPAPDSRQ